MLDGSSGALTLGGHIRIGLEAFFEARYGGTAFDNCLVSHPYDSMFLSVFLCLRSCTFACCSHSVVSGSLPSSLADPHSRPYPHLHPIHLHFALHTAHCCICCDICAFGTSSKQIVACGDGTWAYVSLTKLNVSRLLDSRMYDGMSRPSMRNILLSGNAAEPHSDIGEMKVRTSPFAITPPHIFYSTPSPYPPRSHSGVLGQVEVVTYHISVPVLHPSLLKPHAILCVH